MSGAVGQEVVARAEVRARPILFSGEMVRAIRNGQKTQTRRTRGLEQANADPNRWAMFAGVLPGGQVVDLGGGVVGITAHGSADTGRMRCPYGRVGDQLWVRETWRPRPEGLEHAYLDYAAGGCNDDPALLSHIRLAKKGSKSPSWQKWEAKTVRVGLLSAGPPPWVPSIHMPRWASRITLEITDIRLERLQAITEADAIAEGIQNDQPVQAFMELWDRLNAKRGYPSEDNPWVWVVGFKLIEDKTK